jgi:hypothetical protein
VQSRDPLLLGRLEPDPSWSGRELLRHIREKNPQVLMAMELLRHSAWQARLHEGYRRLREAGRRHASEPQVLLGEAMLLRAAGDHSRAAGLLAETTNRYPEVSTASLRESLEHAMRGKLDVSMRYWEDADDRNNAVCEAAYRMHPRGLFTPTLALRSGRYAESGREDIAEAAPRVGVSWFRDPFNRVELGVGLSLFSDPADETVTGWARWHARWSDSVGTVLSAEREPVYTARALGQDIHTDTLRADVSWSVAASDLRVVARFTRYSDGNDRVTPTLEIGRPVERPAGLRGLCRLTWDDTSRDRADYYSPQELRLFQVGIEYRTPPGRNVGVRVRYLPGYGIETGESDRLIHSVYADGLFELPGAGRLRPLISFQRNPTYRSTTLLLRYAREF